VLLEKREEVLNMSKCDVPLRIDTAIWVRFVKYCEEHKIEPFELVEKILDGAMEYMPVDEEDVEVKAELLKERLDKSVESLKEEDLQPEEIIEEIEELEEEEP